MVLKRAQSDSILCSEDGWEINIEDATLHMYHALLRTAF